MSQRIEFHSRSGKPTPGELVEPEGVLHAPAVVLLQEYWGVNQHIKALLDRLAAAGFLALAPDLYHGRITRDPKEAGAWAQALDRAQAMDEIAGAVRLLKAHRGSNGHVGVMGFCLGGALAFAAATAVPELEAVVPFYGVPDPKTVDYSKVRAPVLAHFAQRDRWATPEAGRAIQAQLEAHGQEMELHFYDADHAFANDTREDVYHPQAAILAWERSTKFLHHKLGGAPPPA